MPMPMQGAAAPGPKPGLLPGLQQALRQKVHESQVQGLSRGGLEGACRMKEQFVQGGEAPQRPSSPEQRSQNAWTAEQGPEPGMQGGPKPEQQQWSLRPVTKEQTGLLAAAQAPNLGAGPIVRPSHRP